MVDDAGNCLAWSEQCWKLRTPGTHLTAGGFRGDGVRRRRRLRRKVTAAEFALRALCRDGSFMMRSHAK
jgi:hypothetical protein